MPRGASTSLCTPEVALEQPALACGDPQWPFQGAVTEGDLENQGHSQCGDTEAPRAHSPPRPPAPNRLGTL